MTYCVEFIERNKYSVLVVGCGGTGGYVAEGLCRLLPENWEISLQDHDRVEERNLCRQNFFASDLGKFKSQALAERLSVNYGRAISYRVVPFIHAMNYPQLIIGCVDNAAARKNLAHCAAYSTWWIDSGNGHHTGQVIVGNVNGGDFIKGAFRPGITRALPNPSTQLPAILIPAPDEIIRPDCATAVQREEQSPLINQMMAVVVLQAVYQLVNQKLAWMSAFIDLERGITFNAIEPATVARLCGVRVDTLFDKSKPGDGDWRDREIDEEDDE